MRRCLVRQLANADFDTKPLAISLELSTGLFKRPENRGAGGIRVVYRVDADSRLSARPIGRVVGKETARHRFARDRQAAARKMASPRHGYSQDADRR